MAKKQESVREQILEELVEAGELYLNLGEYVRAHEIAKIPRKENRQKVEPGLDMIILRGDIWQKIRELAQKLHSL